MVAAGVPTLRRLCLHGIASELLASITEGSGVQPPVQCLPQELRLELLLVLASWRLLDGATLAALGAQDMADIDGSSSDSQSAGIVGSLLEGAASVSLSGCVLLGAAGLRPLFSSSLPLLCTLSLKGLLWLADADVALVAQHCTGLRQLDLSHCPQLTSAAVGAVASGPAGPQLQALSLASCWQVADLPGLAACTQLSKLDLSGCWQLQNATVKQVLASAELLEELSLAGCSWLNSQLLVTEVMPGKLSMPQTGAALPLLPLPVEPQYNQQHFGDHLEAWERRRDGGIQPVVWHEPAGREGQYHTVEDDDLQLAAYRLLFPSKGIPLPQLRTLDVSGTQVDDALLYWLAQRCCCRLQKLALNNTQVSGAGVAAVLAAKRALLHHQACRHGRQAAGGSQQRAAAGPGAVPEPAGVLPFLDLAAATTHAFCAGALPYSLPSPLMRAVQRNWEAAQGGGILVHLGHSGTPTSGGASSSCTASPAPLRLCLLEPPPDLTCPHCPSTSANVTADVAAWQQPALHYVTGAALQPLMPGPDDPPASWPPETPAAVLAALGPAGLFHLQSLDVSGTGGTSALADLISANCSSLRRLRLAGCTSLSDSSLEQILEAAPLLQELDVSDCSGSRVSRPGSRFLRHKAPRQQEGGVTDASLRLLPCEPQESAGSAHRQQVQGQRASGTAITDTPQGTTLTPSGLQALNISQLSVTDATLSSLPASLTSLQLRGCKRVTNTGLLQLLARCCSLGRVDGVGCSQLTEAGFGCYVPLNTTHESTSEPMVQRPQQQRQQQRHRHVAGMNGAAGGQWEAQLCGGSAGQLQSHSAVHAGSSEPGWHQWRWGQLGQLEMLLQRQLPAFRQVVSTAPTVRLQRAALPKQACSQQVLAWLAGQSQAGASSGPATQMPAMSASSSGPAGCPPLQRLELASCSSLTEGSLVALAACCQQLKSLQLGDAGTAAGSALCSALGLRCRLLTRLTIDGGSALADVDLALLLHQLPALQHLSISGASSISGAVFIQWHAEKERQPGPTPGTDVADSIEPAQPAASVLATPAAAAAVPSSSSGAVPGCQPLPMPAMATAAEPLPVPAGPGGPACFMLRTLRLEGSGLGDDGASAAAAACPHLEVLSLRQCERVTAITAVAMLSSCTNLRELLLGGTAATAIPDPRTWAAYFAAAAAGWPGSARCVRQLVASGGVPEPSPRASMLMALELPKPLKTWDIPHWTSFIDQAFKPPTPSRNARVTFKLSTTPVFVPASQRV